MHKASTTIIACCLLLAVCIAAVAATKVSQCPGQSFENLQERVSIQNCNKPPCKLRKKSNIAIDIKFTPEKDIKELRTNVQATVLGIPLPFIGVDGYTACDKVFMADDDTVPVSCPLKKGTEYIYKNSFPILEVYPRLSTVVHWSLSQNEKDIVCFEVPAKIL